MKFGPAGNSQEFYDQGHKASVDAPQWIAAQGLSAYEYSAGRGVSLSEGTATKIGDAAKAHGVSVSIHAPYYINCATPDPDKREKTFGYFIKSAQALRWLGGNRLIFHPGSPGKDKREDAYERMMDTIIEVRNQLDQLGYDDILLCPETMGRPAQLGSLEEIASICKNVERTIPTIDFGHLHTVGLGALNSEQDFRSVLDYLIKSLGFDRVQYFHAHFSRIEYTDKGEKCHHTFADKQFGPEFDLLAPVLVEYDLKPTIICESAGTQASDAVYMKNVVQTLKNR